MHRTLALVPLLAVAALAEEGSLPFRLGAKGFEEGQAPCRIELLHKGPVETATGTLDGDWLVWKVAGTLFVRRGQAIHEIAVPSKSRLLGCTRDGRLLVAEPASPDPVLAAYDLAGGTRAVLRVAAASLLGEAPSGLLAALDLIAARDAEGFSFQALDGKPAGKAACGTPVLSNFGAREVVVVPRDGKPVLLAPDSAPAPLDPVLEGATGVALSPDRPFFVMSTAFDVGFVCLSTPGLRPLPIEGYTPLAWPSRSAILLSKADGLYLLTLTDDGPAVDEAALRAEEEKRRLADEEARKRAEAEQARLEAEKQAEAERKRLEQERAAMTDAERARREEEEKRKQAEAEQARIEEERRAEAERKRLEGERAGLTDAERARREEEEKRKLAEAEAARLEAEKRRLAEEERKRQEEAERAQQEGELELVDFAGLAKARIGDLADAVKAALSEPDQREEGEEEGTTDWIYASRGLVLTFEDETKQLVRVLAKGKPDFLPAALKDRFRPYKGKTGKGVTLGASRADIEAAYGKPAKVLTVGAAEMLRYDGDKARMSFQIERGKLVLILVQREK